MLSLSAIARKEKNELSTDSAFIVLLDIRLGEETVRICYNTDDVTWNGNLYQAFPFTIGEVTENTDGSDPDVELKVDNVSQALQYAVEEANGGNGTEVILRVGEQPGVGNRLCGDGRVLRGDQDPGRPAVHHVPSGKRIQLKNKKTAEPVYEEQLQFQV